MVNIVCTNIKIAARGKVQIHSQRYKSQEQRHNYPYNPPVIQTHLDNSSKFAH
ncbi:protein of unknown function [Candidatus Nitrotoga arctica]|uniref:Uncharacterized protein n=1 Tax=Candidatus Nitrotoga arctica TaxID=453162 RepID=A0ABN8AH04_9PROT|nr:protein of unknown function [Candidatus Nitrotoga arctica]